MLKVGSAVIAGPSGLDRPTLGRIARDIAGARAAGARVVLVSSGAVACGLAEVAPHASDPARLSIADRQAAAAAGQSRLIAGWADALAPHGIVPAQVLLTADDIDFRARFVNARRTLARLLDLGLLPVVNENDSVAFDEIKLGDNDRLAALVGALADADLLVLLSRADGLRRGGPEGRLIEEITDFDEAASHATDERSPVGTGGMRSKLEAARTASQMGIEVVIAGARAESPLARALRAEPVGTRVMPPASAPPHAARKRWIAHALVPRATLTVDEGARTAIESRGASLLPRGVVGIDPADVPPGTAVDVRTPGGGPFARGLIAYSGGEIQRIRGLPTDGIEAALGYRTADEIIHRDDMILLRDTRI